MEIPSQVSFSKNPKLALTSFYAPETCAVEFNAPQYQLPLNLEEIANIRETDAQFELSEAQKTLLAKNGFVVIDYGFVADVVEPYKDMKGKGIPIFVTIDTLLHLYHIQFNETLTGIEEREFFDELVDLSKAMLQKSMDRYKTSADPNLKEAARRNVAYFAVALKLLQTPTQGYDEKRIRREIRRWNKEFPWDKKTFEPIRKVDFRIPGFVRDTVNKEWQAIEEHEGFKPSAILRYSEDYSQYVPRGHYTRSEKLKRYFKAMTWYGRMAFLLKGGDKDSLVTEEDAKIATIQASLISLELPNTKIGSQIAQDVWNRIYSVTAFFVGVADDLTPHEYLHCLRRAFGNTFDATELAQEDKLLSLKAELAALASPQIYGGSGVCVVYPPITKEKLYQCLSNTKGMHFIGQRFTPDSYMFQNLVSPAVGMYVGNRKPFTMCMTELGPARCFPCGLDVMAVLGSKRAEDILRQEGDMEYEGEDTSYEKQLSALKEVFPRFTETDWNRNLYWSWLYALIPLLNGFQKGYPSFMQTGAWQDKELQTALASWAELKHDTILYAKPSYAVMLKEEALPPKPVIGYVEPVPEFYARVLALTKMTRRGLTQLRVLGQAEELRLETLEVIVNRLIKISKDELENRELTEDDHEFIRNFGEHLEGVVANVESEGKETTMVADVHTDINTGQVLEEGIGYVDLILVAHKVPDGRVIIGAGPVFSYYEFKHPHRLTDEEWKDLLKEKEPRVVIS